MANPRSEFTGKLTWPQFDTHVPSEFLDLGSDLGYILPTLTITSDARGGTPGRIFHIRWNQKENRLDFLNTFDENFRFYHGRNAVRVAGMGDHAFVLADHGIDAQPFPGGESTFFQFKNGQWEKKRIFPGLAFHFDVSASGRVIPGKQLLAFSNLNSKHSNFALINGVGELEEAPRSLSFPEELSFHNYMTLKFVDVDNDGTDELVVGGRGPHSQDCILKFREGGFQFFEWKLPPRRFSHWDTVEVNQLDLDGKGNLGLVFLSHDNSISFGAMDIFKLSKNGFTKMPRVEALDSIATAGGQWIHRAKAVRVFGGGDDILLTMRRTDYGLRPASEQVVLLRNRGDHFEKCELGLDFLYTLILGADIVVDREGNRCLLALKFDGTYLVSRLG